MSAPFLVSVLLVVSTSLVAAGEPLVGTQPLTASGDLSVQMVEGIDRWLTREQVRVAEARKENWRKDTASPEAWAKAVGAHRERLAKVLGVVDSRRPGALQTTANAGEPPVAAGEGYSVEAVRWPVFDGVYGEGLLLRPSGPAKAAVIALPDADQTPEQFAGIQPGVEPELQFGRRLAERGFLVVVPVLVDRRDNWSGNEQLQRFTNVPHREWIYRQAFEVGRTIAGFEVQKVLAAVDSLKGPSAKLLAPGAKIGVAGTGEGGLVALQAAALDTRLEAASVIGYFGTGGRDEVLYRNLFGSRRRFSDSELATLIGPRSLSMLVPEVAKVKVAAPPESRDRRRVRAPGELIPPDASAVSETIRETNEYRERLGMKPVQLCMLVSGWLPDPEAAFASAFGIDSPSAKANKAPVVAPTQDVIDARQWRTVRELEDFTQAIFRDSERTRKALPIWTKLKPGGEWDAVQKSARADFWKNVIGKLPVEYSPPNPRTRLVHDKEKWRGYEVMLDVHPDVFAWGILLVPRDLKPGERRPVVVCQHGLEGVPEDTITEDQTANAWKYYKGFAARLADQGFIVYAPHNPYRGAERFRWLQRKANPLGLSLYSFIIAQHDVTTRWLASLPFVDAERIGFYGLSYGGKTAMRVPAVLDRYCLSICSGDFNEWVLKCMSNTHPAGYIFTSEWEIWEWDLGHTFNYAEMALLIAPRPFMVERGHDDGVGLDEHVGYEWGKVRRGYDKLGVPERAEIEWFDGPHTINAVGTFKFLHKWLRWPER